MKALNSKGQAVKSIIAAAVLVAAQAPAQVISEQELIAAVLVGEAGGEGSDGMCAVLEVVWTRHLERKQTFLEVITTRKAFSCMNSKTPQALVQRSRSHKEWNYAMLLAEHRPRSRLAKGANHFHKTNINPRWARGKRPVAIIGNHKFYRL